jgi:hypothetical protein
VLVMLQLDLFTKTVAIGKWQTAIHFLDLPVWLAGLFTAISGAGYIVYGIAQLNVHGQAEQKPPDQPPHLE